MELDKIYNMLVLVHKKNYVGVIRPSPIPNSSIKNESKPKLIVRGLAGKKSDRCLWVREAFTNMLEDYMNNVNPCIRLRQEIIKLETGEIENKEERLLMHKNLNQNPQDYENDVIQKLIGVERDLQNGDTAHYYMADNDKNILSM